ncbi:MAG: hypothetical protein ACTSU5_19415 [Promethearchaeota archaeon]
MEELTENLKKMMEETDELVFKDVQINVDYLELGEPGVMSLDSKKKKKKKK